MREAPSLVRLDHGVGGKFFLKPKFLVLCNYSGRAGHLYRDMPTE